MKRRQFIQAGAGASLGLAAQLAAWAQEVGVGHESATPGDHAPQVGAAQGGAQRAVAPSGVMPSGPMSKGPDDQHEAMKRVVKSIYAPTRYVFVADRFSNFISVTDIVSGEHIETLNFSMRPHVMELARDDAMLAVGSPEVSAIEFMNLRTRERRRVELPSPVFQIFFVPQTNLVAVGLRDQVGMISYKDFSVRIFPRRFDSDQRQTLINTYYSLLFSSFSQSFWVLDEDRPFIYHRYGGAEPLDAPWKTIDLSRHIGTGSGLGIGVASPEDDLLAMTTDDGSEGLVYFPAQDKVLSTGPMRTVGSTNEPMIMPYIDAYSKHVIFADMEGNVALFDLVNGNGKPERFTVKFSPRFIRTGWLESTWILAGDKGIMFQSFKDPSDRKVVRFVPEVMNMWVTGDSKTALYTLDEGAPTIYRFDIRTREQLPPIRVRGVTMASMLRMGSNNSICY